MLLVYYKNLVKKNTQNGRKGRIVKIMACSAGDQCALGLKNLPIYICLKSDFTHITLFHSHELINLYQSMVYSI